MQRITLIFIECVVLLTVNRVFAQRSQAQKDTIVIWIHNSYDTANIKYSQPDIRRIILTKYNYPDYTAPGAISFDIKRTFDFKLSGYEVAQNVNWTILGPNSISDSVKAAPHTFFHHHTFFVILTKGDTSYFYRAKGQYLYKNFDNDVRY